jgi:hypothetical protein
MGIGTLRLHRAERERIALEKSRASGPAAAQALPESLEELERLTAPEPPRVEPKKGGRK